MQHACPASGQTDIIKGKCVMSNTGNGRLRLLLGGSQSALPLPPSPPSAAKSPRPFVLFPPAANGQRRPASTFPGFDNGTRDLPAPALMLGDLLAEITDEAELKCALRFLWHQAQVAGSPKRVPAERLLTDGVLLAALGSRERAAHGVQLAVERGLLLEADGWLLLNTPRNRMAAGTLGRAPNKTAAPGAAPPPTIFALYEENIGALTPMIADELRDAEKEYPVGWVEDAIKEAASSNARSWRYIVAVLERWKREGKGNRGRGKPGRNIKTLTAAEFLKLRRAS